MFKGTPILNPVSAAWNTVARFDEYEAAQRAVDRLSDDASRSTSSTSSAATCG